MSINPNICRNLEDRNSDVVNFQEVAQAKVSGSDGGYNHFTGMTVGTRFASIANGWSDSSCDEYVLMSKQGMTVLLQNETPRPDYNPLERHLSSKFWKLNTLVQILHIPDASEASPPPLIVGGRTTNGNGAED